ncbi:MAG: leucine--tRNA ligase [Candidatus Aenigmatarchaeota archaeon]|nr:MAG: leucine--tRNA ligase [Candidatus Aenigmarchaeota archaeon]
MDFREIEEKWKKRWEEEKIFESNPDNREKFFVNTAYPYVNGYGHLGHLFTFLRTEILARFKRMQGFNVLFPQGFHATGQPIVAAAKRINEKEEKQTKILRDMGIPEEDLEKFSDINHWIKYFPEKWKENLKDLGFSIDWRRSFITTEINKPYDSFVKWQFLKLKGKNLVNKGNHAVVFCEKCGFPIGDHDRAEGEGVVPEEVILLKFELEGFKLPVMTYRPETIYGVTNLWINPEETYVQVEVSGEKWIISKNMVENLKKQDFEVNEIKEIKGSDFIKKKVLNPVTNKEAITLPASFVDIKIGSGIVMCVPAHAPFDYAGVKELRENKELREKYELTEEDLKFDFISLIKLEEFGEFPAVELVEKMNIKSQKEKDKLEIATKEIYKKEFHSGILKIKGLEGKKVSEVKDELTEKFIRDEIGVKYFILPEKVICRCLNPGTIKIVKDQWFINYSNKDLKKKTHELVDRMRYYPPEIKENFHYTIDWLNDWACTRDKKTSIGTTLPFDETQVIESLSDSTLYMAYYTISNYLQEGKLKNDKVLNEEFFDYIFLGKGEDLNKISEANNIEVKSLKKMKEEFFYWYKNGFQVRNSGKDLIQNHLTFCMFNHTAIFPEENLPTGISVNGHVMLDGEKMSKSKGNVVFMKDAIKDYSIDSLRFIVAYAGTTGMDDVNIELKEIKSIGTKLKRFYEFATSDHETYEEYKNIDKWFESVINRTMKKVYGNYDNLETKLVLQIGFFELQNHFKWYKRRTTNYNKELLLKFIELQTKILAPITPFLCEEIWEKTGNSKFISLDKLPEVDEEKIDKAAEKNEEIISNLLEDIKTVIGLAKVGQPKKIKIVVPEEWKYKLFSELDKKLEETRDFSELIKEGMKFEEARKKSKEIQRLIKRVLSSGTGTFNPEENKLLEENKEFLEKEFECEIEITKETIKESWPGKFGILVE